MQWVPIQGSPDQLESFLGRWINPCGDEVVLEIRGGDAPMLGMVLFDPMEISEAWIEDEDLFLHIDSMLWQARKPKAEDDGVLLRPGGSIDACAVFEFQRYKFWHAQLQRFDDWSDRAEEIAIDWVVEMF